MVAAWRAVIFEMWESAVCGQTAFTFLLKFAQDPPWNLANAQFRFDRKACG